VSHPTSWASPGPSDEAERMGFVVGTAGRALAGSILSAVSGYSAAWGAAEDQPVVSQPPTSPSPVGNTAWPLSATVTLTPTGPEPSSIVINVGGRVTFVNNDVRAHDMVSDPDLRHDECPVLNRVGFLAPGQSRQSGVFEVVQNCGFHDHLEPTQFLGRIDVRW
jgi:hypothetical protein